MNTKHGPGPEGNALPQLLQAASRRFLKEELGRGPWICVYQFSRSGSGSTSVFSALIPNKHVANILKDPGWDVRIGDALPSCTVRSMSGRRRTSYSRFGSSEFEPLVVHRSFHGLRKPYLEILEEFRLYHDLYHDQDSGQHLKFDDDGDEDAIIRMTDEIVEIRLREILEFIAIRRMHLALYVDLRRYSPLSLEEVPQSLREEEFRDSSVCYTFHVGPWLLPDENRRTFSRFLGKKLIAPPPVKECGRWPYKKNQEDYEDFMISTDNQGQPVFHSCNPGKLSNYFGANPGAPHYLTPVHFRREVLAKYYAQPGKYSVEDGYLRCSGLWGMSIDNNHERYVMAYLGDLGRDLSAKERAYWRSFNVLPEGSLSPVAWRRDFLAEFAPPERADLIFKSTFQKFSNKWFKKMGWHLFKPLEADDMHLYTALRIPLTNDQAEFDQQVLGLTKLLIDSLNEAELERLLGPPTVEGEKGISKFERFLSVSGLPEVNQHIEFLRNLQALRSSGVGHRKGTNYKKASAKFGLRPGTSSAVAEGILASGTELLRVLGDHFLAERPSTEEGR